MQPQTMVIDMGDDFITPPSGSLFYELVTIPSGPGVEELKSVLEVLPPLSLKEGPWVAGGCARRLLQGQSLKRGDIDLFFKSDKSWRKFCDALEKHELVVKTNRATTFLVNGLKVQCIRRKYYLTLEEVFKDFDFSVCQVATDGKYLAVTKQANLDIAKQILRFAPCGTIAKSTLVQRMSKYVNYGFIPEPGLFELIVKSGLDYVSAYSIFSDVEMAIYDEFNGEEIEEIIPVEGIDEEILRSIAQNLGLEIPND